MRVWIVFQHIQKNNIYKKSLNKRKNFHLSCNKCIHYSHSMSLAHTHTTRKLCAWNTISFMCPRGLDFFLTNVIRSEFLFEIYFLGCFHRVGVFFFANRTGQTVAFSQIYVHTIIEYDVNSIKVLSLSFPWYIRLGAYRVRVAKGIQVEIASPSINNYCKIYFFFFYVLWLCRNY